jgi:hypothetical protein
MQKSYLISTLLLATALFAVYHQEARSSPCSFADYKQTYSKVYAKAGEEEYRKAIFLRNLGKIQQHNGNISSTWEMGVNQFTDLTEAEFAAIYLAAKVP